MTVPATAFILAPLGVNSSSVRKKAAPALVEGRGGLIECEPFFGSRASDQAYRVRIEPGDKGLLLFE